MRPNILNIVTPANLSRLFTHHQLDQPLVQPKHRLPRCVSVKLQRLVRAATLHSLLKPLAIGQIHFCTWCPSEHPTIQPLKETWDKHHRVVQCHPQKWYLFGRFWSIARATSSPQNEKDCSVSACFTLEAYVGTICITICHTLEYK